MVREKLIFLLLILVSILSMSVPTEPSSAFVKVPLQTTLSPYSGTGNEINIYEFARNDSSTFFNAHNNTAFSYSSSWFPANYQGYQMHAEITNLRKSVNPINNGDFDQ
ncbi:MAG: hypothetical protein ACFFD8_09235, partial [Candidatus Thorarchaeota archaeon]